MKKLKKFLVVLFATFSLASVKIFANPIDYNSSVGFHYMLGSGFINYGLQYQHWFTDKIGLTTEGMIYYQTFYNNNPNFAVNVNAEFDYMLFSSAFSTHTGMKLYAFLEAGYFGGFDNRYNLTTSNYDYSTFNNLITAVGFISEFDFFEHIAIPLKFGFGGTLPYESSLGFVFGSGIKFLF